jgi:hypothetical protein
VGEAVWLLLDDPCCDPFCVLEVLEEEVVVELVCPVLGDVLPGVLCATTHVAQKSSTDNNAVLLFMVEPPEDCNFMFKCFNALSSNCPY